MKKLFFSLILFVGAASLEAQQRIIFFLRSYPLLAEHINEHQLLKGAPGQAMRRVLNIPLFSHPVGGVFATYAGYLDASSPDDGSIMFPRKHTKTLFHFVVTKQVEPVIMIGKTVHHWELLPGVSAAVYRIERLQDPDTKLFYWQVTKDELPDNKIPLDGIILFASPHDVRIPEGITLTDNDPQLELPDIYVNEGYDPITAAFRVLQVNHFFRLLQPIYKAGGPTSWEAQIVEQ